MFNSLLQDQATTISGIILEAREELQQLEKEQIQLEQLLVEWENMGADNVFWTNVFKQIGPSDQVSRDLNRFMDFQTNEVGSLLDVHWHGLEQVLQEGESILKGLGAWEDSHDTIMTDF